MTNSNRSFVFAYVLLVALPLFGLAGVLRSGRNLSAPMSVGGIWKVTVNQDQLTAMPCGKSLQAQVSAFTISQSGKAFTLTFPNSAWTSISGAVEGNKLTASLTPSAAAARDAGCGNRFVSLTAMVDAKSTPRSLQGTLHLDNCPECEAVALSGLRDEQANSKGTP